MQMKFEIISVYGNLHATVCCAGGSDIDEWIRRPLWMRGETHTLKLNIIFFPPVFVSVREYGRLLDPLSRNFTHVDEKRASIQTHQGLASSH